MKICFATNNSHKLLEVKALLPQHIEALALNDIDCHEELPETGDTLEFNSRQKAKYVQDNYKIDCFADDTGLEVEALNGRPGVYSARYAGEPSDSSRNIRKLLEEMNGKVNRKARFRTVVTLLLSNHEFVFQGVMEGTISLKPLGENGFGYDPVFIPDGYDITFAQMSANEKNAISHRSKAIRKLVDFLSQEVNPQ